MFELKKQHTSSWISMPISSIGTVVGGGTPSTKNPEYYDGNIAWITPKDLSNIRERYISRGERSISQDGYDNSGAQMLPAGTVLFSSRAPIGYIAIAKNELCTNQGFKSIIPKSDVCVSEFLYYLLRYYKQDIESIASGTTFMEVSGSAMKNFIVRMPDVSTQKKIASILSSLDEKIELNHKINQNLEAQAQAIFKSWFADFEPFQNGKFIDSELGPIPDGWRVGALSDIAEITMGQSPRGESYNENSYGVVFYQGRAEFSDRFPIRRLFTTEPKRMGAAGDVLLSVRAPVGDMNIASESCCIGRGLAAIHAKNDFTSFIFYTMRALKPELDKYNGEGTVFGCINKEALNAQKIIIPPISIISEFEKKVQPMDRRYLAGAEENKRLMQLRDTLLPRLMSKEIDASEIEI